MFSFFKKNKKPQIPAEVKVWMTWEAHYTGFVKELESYLNSGQRIALVAFFPRTMRELEQILENQNVTFQRLERVSERASSEKIPLISAGLIANFVQQGRNPFESQLPEVFLIAEQYPIFSTETQLLQNLAVIAPQSKALIFTDLESPLLKSFGGDNVILMMEKLGMKADECIQHSFVTKSIGNAQKKLEARVLSEMKADSIQEWFDRNI